MTAQRPFPNHSLQVAIALAQAIQDNNNGQPMNRVLLAGAMGRKPSSSDFRMLLSSGVKYGLTVGNEKSEAIGLTEIGTGLTKPRGEEERAESLRRAALSPELFKRLYEHYNNGKLPQGDFLLTVLERNHGVPRERCSECAEVLIQNAQLAGIVREQMGTLYVVLNSTPSDANDVQSHDVAEQSDPDSTLVATEEPPVASVPARVEERLIFVGHGKNRKPLEQLKQVLDQFKIPYKLAVEEPQEARPISVKVAQVMKECHSAILLFTADEEFRDADGETIWRPSENVVHELGAASVLYENRIVILREDRVAFPTNFRDIGHITFETDRLDAKGLDLVRELIGLGLLKVLAA